MAAGGGGTARARTREVLAQRGFRRLLLTRILSQAGDGIFQIAAAAVLLFEHPGPNPATDLFVVTAITAMPFSAIAPFVGVFIDRWDRRAILVRVPIARGLIAVTLPLAALAGTHSVPFYAVVLIVVSANRFFLATAQAVTPQLVPGDDLLVANSVSTISGSVSYAAGQGIGAGLATLMGGQTTAVIGAIALGAAGLLARGVPVRRAMRTVRRELNEELAEVFGQMREGFRAVSRSPRVVRALGAVGVTQVLTGAMLALFAYHFIHVLGQTIGSAAPVPILLAAGIGVGVFAVPVAARRATFERLIFASFVIGTIGTGVGVLSLSRIALIAGAGIIGLSYPFVKLPVDTIVQQEMTDALRGRAFAVYDLLFNAGRLAGMAITAGLYAAGASSRGIAAGICICYAAAAVFGTRERGGTMRWGKRTRPTTQLQAGEMVTVRAYAGSRADEEPRAIVSGGAEIAIDAIDWRAVVEENGRRARVFVVRAGGQRVRLARYEDAGGWEIERILPPPAPETAPND